MPLAWACLLWVGLQGAPTSPTPQPPPVRFEGEHYHRSAERLGSFASTANFSLRYRLDQDLAPGGAVRLSLGYPWQGRTLRVMRANIWSPFQIWQPRAANYLSVHVPGNADFQLVTPPPGGLWTREVWVEIVPTRDSNPLLKGQEIEFRIGDPSQGSPGYRLSEQSADVWILVEERRDAGSPFELRYPASAFPRIEVGPMTTDRFSLHVDSIRQPGERARLIVQARENDDSFFRNSGIDRSFTGLVHLQPSRPLPGLPASILFTEQDRGVKTIWFDASGSGAVRIEASLDGATQIRGESNPLLVREPVRGTPTPRLYWGNLHVHSTVGGHALGLPREAFRWAREVEGFDFMGLTEHCSMPTGNDFDWDWLRHLDEDESRPGRFVGFVGYEWTSDRSGHRNVVLKHGTDLGDAFCLGDGNRAEQLLAAMAGHRAIGIPHHSAWAATGPMDWGSALAHPNQPLVEIYSWHGSSEYYGNPLPMQQSAIKNHPPGLGAYVQEALRAGYRMGFTADSDHHLARPGSNIAFPQRYARMGLTGVWTTRLDREGIWHGLTQRHTIATTGARAIGWLQIENAIVGGELYTDRDPELRIELFGTEDIVELTVFRNGDDPVLELTPQQRDLSLTWIDLDTAPGELHSYYVRAVQADGHRIWLSPIWVRREAGSGTD